MKITKFLFCSCMAGTFALSVILTWLYVPAPPPEFNGAATVICAAVIFFCTGVLCFGLGCHLQAKEIESDVAAKLRERSDTDERILQELRSLWGQIPSGARPGAVFATGGGEDDDKPMRRAYSGE
ncbi:hypothetical protein [Microvirga sesbaniae]|uniref:hypothetical protein n=1 Tax=Microvirga sesbaniae TaxID=681392 RepID=UPI0021C90EA1|nr:hypothetical protein [Microvirga sp. HBU67692]